MFDVKLNLNDKGLWARFGRVKDILLRRGKKVEQELRQGNDVGGEVSAPRYRTDAEESLAMALGKQSEGNIFSGSSEATSDIFKDL